jgi:hypothetical protein
MFFSTYLNIFTTYLPINFKNNNPNIDFNLGIKLTWPNGPLSTSQIVSHYASQNDKVQFDYPIALDMAKMICLD